MTNYTRDDTISNISSISDDGSDYDGSEDDSTPTIFFVTIQYPTIPVENNSTINTTDKYINTIENQSATVQPPKPISTDIHNTLLSNWPSATTNPGTIISYLENAWQQIPEQHNSTHVLPILPQETLLNHKIQTMRARERQKQRRKLRANSTVPLHHIQSKSKPQSQSDSDSVPTSEPET